MSGAITLCDINGAYRAAEWVTKHIPNSSPQINRCTRNPDCACGCYGIPTPLRIYVIDLFSG